MAKVLSGCEIPAEMSRLTSTVSEDGATLTLKVDKVPTPRVKEPTEILVRVEASPINPSDLGLMTARLSNEAVSAAQQKEGKTEIAIPKEFQPFSAQRQGKVMPTGNESAGVVVEAGSDPAAQKLLGKVVGLIGGEMHAEYRLGSALPSPTFRSPALEFPDGVSSKEAASWFVNPLTVLGFMGTLKKEGHKGMVHTAAASQLGQMLQKVCTADGVALVNIVRKQEQEDILRGIGAKWVVNMSKETFLDDLAKALEETDATLGFDATGGGELCGQILGQMEKVQSAMAQAAGTAGPYGSSRHKQVYIYGGLQLGPTTLHRNYGMAWGLGGWLLPNYMQKATPEEIMAMRARVAAEIKTTFKTEYSREISLEETASAEAIIAYQVKGTGQKVLVTPQKKS